MINKKRRKRYFFIIHKKPKVVCYCCSREFKLLLSYEKSRYLFHVLNNFYYCLFIHVILYKYSRHMQISSRSPQSASKRYYFQLLPTAIQAHNFKQINDERASTINYKFNVIKGSQDYGQNKIPISVKTYEHPQIIQLNEGANIINFYIPVYNPHRQVNFTLKFQTKYTEQNQFKVAGQINIDSNKIVEAYNNQGVKNHSFTQKVTQNLTITYEIFVQKDRVELNNLVKQQKPNLISTSTAQNNEIIKSFIQGSKRSPIQLRLSNKIRPVNSQIISLRQDKNDEVKQNVNQQSPRQGLDSDISPGRPSLSKNWSKKSNPSDVEPLNQKDNEVLVNGKNRILQMKSSRQIPEHPFGQNPKLPKQSVQHLEIERNQQKNKQNAKENISVQSISVSIVDNQGDNEYIQKYTESNQSPKKSYSNIADCGSNQVSSEQISSGEQQIRMKKMIEDVEIRLKQQKQQNRNSVQQQPPKIKRINSITIEQGKSKWQLYLQILVIIIALAAFYYFILHPMVQRNLFRAPKKYHFGK